MVTSPSDSAVLQMLRTAMAAPGPIRRYCSSNKEALVLLAYCSHAEPHIEAAMAHIDAISNLEADDSSGDDGYRYVCVLANVLGFIG